MRSASNTPHPTDVRARLEEALADPVPSARLHAALTAGTHPEPGQVDALVERCASEPDFYVRDMLTWALTRHPASVTVPRLIEETQAIAPQARSQALHTLSKIGDPRGWTAITRELLQDADAEVARSAWRAAVALVPPGAEAQLAAALVAQLGRGDRDTRLSLSRAIAALGDAAVPVLTQAATRDDEAVRTHAIATERLLHDPDLGFDAAVCEAQRLVALTDAPMAHEEPC